MIHCWNKSYIEWTRQKTRTAKSKDPNSATSTRSRQTSPPPSSPLLSPPDGFAKFDGRNGDAEHFRDGFAETSMEDDGNESDPEDSERPWLCELVLPPLEPASSQTPRTCKTRDDSSSATSSSTHWTYQCALFFIFCSIAQDGNYFSRADEGYFVLYGILARRSRWSRRI